MPFSHKCKQCEIDFISPKRTAKFCSSTCFGNSNKERLVESNKARQKYQPIDGLTRQQVFYRQTNGKNSVRDVEKRHSLILNLGGKCVCCGYDKDVRGMVLDHINGDGHEDRKRIGSKIARYYSKNMDEAKLKLQVLCATCNQIKAMENKEHNKSRRVIEKAA
jgi:hypothetical protein